MRREEGLFVAEGIKMFLEAPERTISQVFVTETALADLRVAGKLNAAGLPYEVLADSVFERACDTKTPQGVLTILQRPVWQLDDILKKPAPFLMILEDLQDPGNVGTIIRTAEGAGADAVILTRGSVDITNPKVIRATMGSIYRVPVLYTEEVLSLAEELIGRGIVIFAAHLRGRMDYYEADYTGGTAFLIGNEGAGLTEAAAEAADRLIRIPMEGQLESLNAAMAAGILMYEAARQRRVRS